MSTRSPRRRTTLADVGRSVGVSAKTVSNVVNGSGWVSQEVRARVLAAIDELGYRPNLAARQLRTGSSGLVSLALPDLKEPYFAEVASSFVDEAERLGLRVSISQTQGLIHRERDAIEAAGLPDLDGIVISPLNLRVQDLRERRCSTPLVLVGEFGGELVGPAGQGCSHVGIDNVAAARSATERLIALGCRRIAAVGFQEDPTRQTSLQRFTGYRQALASAGLPEDPALVGTVETFTRAEGSAAVDRILGRGARPDAMFCFSDTLAFGAVYSLAAHELSVPEDIRLIGFDNIAEGRYSVPLFDTIDPGIDELARECLRLLRSPEDRGGSTTIPYTVVERMRL